MRHSFQRASGCLLDEGEGMMRAMGVEINPNSIPDNASDRLS